VSAFLDTPRLPSVPGDSWRPQRARAATRRPGRISDGLPRRDGTHRRRIDLGTESASEPSFSPDGHRLLFTRTAGIGPGGWVTALRLDGSGVTRRFGLSSGYQYAAWLPR
jgi:hypothetical protein